jgi:hypothetical protein
VAVHTLDLGLTTFGWLARRPRSFVFERTYIAVPEPPAGVLVSTRRALSSRQRFALRSAWDQDHDPFASLTRLAASARL